MYSVKGELAEWFKRLTVCLKTLVVIPGFCTLGEGRIEICPISQVNSCTDWLEPHPSSSSCVHFCKNLIHALMNIKVCHGISYRGHITNEEVKTRIGNAIGPYEDLLTSVKRRTLKWYGHVTQSSGLAKTILQGTVQGGRRRGRQRKRWEDNIKEWTGLDGI